VGARSFRPESAVGKATYRPDAVAGAGAYRPDAITAQWTESVTGELAEESVRLNWLIVALIIAALILVLGLIPLWRTVYRRYAVPPALSTPVTLLPTVGTCKAARGCPEAWAKWARPFGETAVQCSALRCRLAEGDSYLLKEVRYECELEKRHRLPACSVAAGALFLASSYRPAAGRESPVRVAADINSSKSSPSSSRKTISK